MMEIDISKKRTLEFVFLLGLVSLFADATYEGGRSIVGPYLQLLGASAVAVGFIAGLGELVGYGLRILTGLAADRTKAYWTITIAGYSTTFIAIPLLAIAGRWEFAAFLIILDRLGKALRSPARDAILSHATKNIGRGYGFGIHEALDQIGAVLGPLIIAGVFFYNGGYSYAFAILALPALVAFSLLMYARKIYPSPEKLEISVPTLERKGLSNAYWIYLIAASVLGAGYADFALIAYHFKNATIVHDIYIPIFFAFAMASDALSALLLGKVFDKIGISTLAIASAISVFFAPFVFLGNFYTALVGVIIWGIGMGAQESILRAAVAEMTPKERRASAYGIFNMGYGIFWFAGSVLLGLLYDVSLIALVIFSMIAQIISLPLFLYASKKHE
ncbi:MAG: MFS transporter [Thermoplasmata archaeon]